MTINSSKTGQALLRASDGTKPAPLDKAKMTARAVAYAEAGFHVFPVHSMLPNGRCSCGRLPVPLQYRGKAVAADRQRRFPDQCSSPGKHPATRNGHHDASSDPKKVRAMFATADGCNIGWHAGADGFAVIDVDPRNGGDATIESLFGEIGALEGAVIQNTGGGGKHFAARVPYDTPVKGTLGPGIDVKRDGYVVLAPSNHESGRRYRFATDESRDVMLGLRDAPQFPKAYLARMAAGAAKSAGKPKSAAESKAATAREKRLMARLEKARVLEITGPEDLPDHLQDLLDASCNESAAFKETWEDGLGALDSRKQQPGAAFGRVLDDDTIETIPDERDKTHSGWRMRFANLARFQGFGLVQFAQLCRANPASGLDDLPEWQQIRQLARVWIRTDDHDPQEHSEVVREAGNDNGDSPKKAIKTRVQSLDQLALDGPFIPVWLIPDFLPQGVPAILWGLPGSVKTTGISYPAFCAAIGVDWFGMALPKFGTLFCAMESANHTRNMYHGFLAQHRKEMMERREAGDLDCVPVDLLEASLPLYHSKGEATPGEKEIIKQALAMKEKHGVACGLIVIDTLARAMLGGDENRAADVAILSAALDRIVSATGATVIVLAHATKDGADMRGSGALIGNFEGVIKAQRNGEIASMQVMRLKGVRSGKVIRYRSKEIQIGTYPNGEPLNSFILESAAPDMTVCEGNDADEGPVVAKLPKTGTQKRQIYNAVFSLAPDGDLVAFRLIFARLLDEKVKIRGRTRLRPLCESTDDKKSIRKQLDRLCDEGHLEKGGSSYRVTRDPQPEFSSADDEV